MPDKSPIYLYWDSCVFVDHISGTPDRAPEIKRIWDEITKDKDNRIVTSALTIAEVAHANEEKARHKLDSNVVAKLDALWNDPHLFLVEAPQYLMTKARDLMRQATTKGWSLGSADAIHLATAKWVHEQIKPVSEFNTYDLRIFKYSALIGIPINEPELKSPQQTRFLETDDPR